jgi:hypothetical protein
MYISVLQKVFEKSVFLGTASLLLIFKKDNLNNSSN